ALQLGNADVGALGQALAQLPREVRHPREIGHTLPVDPLGDLPPAIGRRSERLGEGLDLSGKEIDKIYRRHTPGRITRRSGVGAARGGIARFSWLGTFSPRYGLTVQESEADAPDFLRRLRAGEAAAFEEMVRTHQHRVFGVALRMLGNAAEAEEIAQE